MRSSPPGATGPPTPPTSTTSAPRLSASFEEIYYFEIADSPEGNPGFGLHATYAARQDRPIDLCVPVRKGDVALVPYGYHGPCVAAPGYDMYYLNVMAGPDEDLVWLAPDDPSHHWIRATWEAQEVDPRLPMAR